VGRGIFLSAGPRKYGSYFRRPLDRQKCGVFSWAGSEADENNLCPTTIFAGLSSTDENKGPKTTAPSRAPTPSRSFESSPRCRLHAHRRAAARRTRHAAPLAPLAARRAAPRRPHAPRRAPGTPRRTPTPRPSHPTPCRPPHAARRMRHAVPLAPLAARRTAPTPPRLPLAAPLPRLRHPTSRRDGLPAPCRRPHAGRRGASHCRRPPHPPAPSRRPPCAVARLAPPAFSPSGKYNHRGPEVNNLY
jgi:hypothetical protein